MNEKIGTKRGLAAMATTLLLVGALFAVVTGVSGAHPVAPAGSATAAWAYGGENNSSGSYTNGTTKVSWSATIDVAVIFNATPNGPNVTELETQRTVGVTLTISASDLLGSLTYTFHAMEASKAYANITNASSVTATVDGVAGQIVPALGIEDASFHGVAALAESLVAKATTGQSVSAYLNASGDANAQVTFAPALGVIPLNLTGVTSWSSSATASPSADWKFAYNWAYHGWNATSASGNGTKAGSWGTSGTVTLNGEVVTVGIPHFRDHRDRQAVIVQTDGPAGVFDGFVVIPRGFDVFAGGAHAYSNESMSDVTLSSETLYLNRGHIGATALTAAELKFGSGQGKQPDLATVPSGLSPAASPEGGSVVAQPESVSTAQSQSHCIEFGCAAAAPWFSGAVALAVIGGVIAAVAGTVGVIEWRSYARRKHRANELVGGYSEGRVVGVPPAAYAPPTASAPQPPMSGPSNEGPGGRL